MPHKAPYDLITGPGGFTDQWLQWAPAEEGWTSGLSETVDDADRGRLRPPHRHGLRAHRGRARACAWTVVPSPARTSANRDPATGLWPSDHGGVVLRLRLGHRHLS